MILLLKEIRMLVAATFIILLLLVSQSLSSQNTVFDQMRKVPITSPEVASLTKAVEFPVSYFNGRPDISIPLYSIQSGDIELPISLSYNAGGVRVAEESSWVGLGWALNAGGIITHDIKGLDDDYNYTALSFNKIFPNEKGTQYDQAAQPVSTVVANNGLFKSTGERYSNNEIFTSLSGSIDGEPDLYIYNFGKFSGKFIWLSATEVVDVSNNNIRFEKVGNTIIATTPDGYKYEFGAIETAIASGPVTRMAYYLTRIISPTNNVITLSYKTFKDYVSPPAGEGHYRDYVGIENAFINSDYVRQLPALSEEYIQYEPILQNYVNSNQPVSNFIPDNSGLNRNFSTSEIRNIYLDRIFFDNGYIQFIHGNRKDLFGVKLDTLKVYNKDGVVIKNVNFLYDYFIARRGNESYTTNGNGYKVDYDESYRKRRLALKSINRGAENYAFNYYEGSDGYTLPYKSSFAQDYWGYYNGAIENTSLVPDFRRYNFLSAVPPILKNWVGANRDADTAKAMEGSLKQIVYPTKGYTEFEYDMNEHHNGPSQQVVSHITPGALNVGAGVTETYVEFTEDTYADIFVQLYCNKPADANPSGAGWDCSCIFPPSCSPVNIQNAMFVMIERVDPLTNQTSLTQWQYDFSKEIVRNNKGEIVVTNALFNRGKYKITANYPDSKVGEVGNRMAYLYLRIPVTDTVGGYGKGGGLRIRSIRNYDPVSNQSVRKYYTYEQANMMKFPSYYAVMENIRGVGAESVLYKTHTLYSSTVIPYSFAANGGLVGYGKVTESYAGNALGRTEYLYTVKPDKFKIMNPTDPDYIPGTPSTAFIDNGFLSVVNVYDKDNQLVKKLYNTPRPEQTKTYWAFKQRKVIDGQYDNSTLTQYLQMCFYPIQSGKVLPGSTKEDLHSEGSVISSLKEFEYNDMGYLKTEKQSTSTGSILSTHYRYATDFDSFAGWITDLKNKNIINNALEVVTKKDDKLVAGSFTTYNSHDSIVTPYEIYQSEINQPVDVPFIAPSGILPEIYKLKGLFSYDSTGNLNFSKETNDISIGYKWGYNGQYAIAECKNATDAEFMFEDFEGNGPMTANSTTAHTGKGAYNGIIDLEKYFSATLNSRIYNLCYFKYDGSNNWDFIEEKYSGQSISGLLDDIRIYPKDGQINTYTFEPLVGMTSFTDPSGRTTYYDYDRFNRLGNIRDQKGYITKTYAYSYASVLQPEKELVYFNDATTHVFTKQCSPGTGSEVPYLVPAGKYTASTQEMANDKAQAEITANGQLNANQSGNCTISTGPPELISVVNGSGEDIIINYNYPSGANYVYMFIKDIAAGTYVNNQPFMLPSTQKSYIAKVTKGKTYQVWLSAGGQYYPTALDSQVITITY